MERDKSGGNSALMLSLLEVEDASLAGEEGGGADGRSSRTSVYEGGVHGAYGGVNHGRRWVVGRGGDS